MRQQDHYTYEYTNIEQEIKMLGLVSILFIYGKWLMWKKQIVKFFNCSTITKGV